VLISPTANILSGWASRNTWPTDAAFNVVQINLIGLASVGCLALAAALETRARWIVRFAGPVAFEWSSVAAMIVGLSITAHGAQLSLVCSKTEWFRPN
jgi:hypothetical protein